MTRYKGRTKRKTIERDFPHHVEMIVPEGGFGKRLDEMYGWHHAHEIPATQGRGRRDENNRDYATWCFADYAIAEAFALGFGGKLRRG